MTDDRMEWPKAAFEQLQKKLEEHSPTDAPFREAEVRECFDELPYRERRILELRYGLEGESPWTITQVGRTFNVTREWIRKLEKRAFKRVAVCISGRRLAASRFTWSPGDFHVVDAEGRTGERVRDPAMEDLEKELERMAAEDAPQEPAQQSPAEQARAIWEDRSMPFEEKKAKIRALPNDDDLVVASLKTRIKRVEVLQESKRKADDLRTRYPSLRIVARHRDGLFILSADGEIGSMIDEQRSICYLSEPVGMIIRRGGWEEPYKGSRDPYYLAVRVGWPLEERMPQRDEDPPS